MVLACHPISPCKFGFTDCAIVGSVVGGKENLPYYSVVSAGSKGSSDVPLSL